MRSTSPIPAILQQTEGGVQLSELCPEHGMSTAARWPRKRWRKLRVSIALACRAVGLGETCYRNSPSLRVENERIADLLVGLTNARKTWGLGLCFLHLGTKPRRRLKREKLDALAVRT